MTFSDDKATIILTSGHGKESAAFFDTHPGARF